MVGGAGRGFAVNRYTILRMLCGEIPLLNAENVCHNLRIKRGDYDIHSRTH